jgi:hypothetical protein
MQFTSFKRGTTFTGTIRYVPRADNLPNLIGGTATSRIKDTLGRRHTLDCTISEDGLTITVTGSSDVTIQMTLGPAFWDVAVDVGGSVIATNTWQFEVTELISVPS